MSVQDEVMRDLQDRKQIGVERYGAALEPHNGRRSLQDAYEEAIDLTQYLKQRLLEDEAFQGFLKTCSSRKCPCGLVDTDASHPKRGWCPGGMDWLHSYASHLVGTWKGKPEEQQG